jgi:hypothetical protein
MLLAAILLIQGGTMPERATIGAPKDIRFHDIAVDGNPFFVDLRAVATHENGHSLELPLFYEKQGTWTARIAFPEIGTWEVVVVLEGTTLSPEPVELECEFEEDPFRGGLAVDPANPRNFVYRDGTPFFMLSYEADWLWALEAVHPDENRVGRFLDRIARNGFNTVLMNVYAYDTSWCPGNTSPFDYGPAPLAPWIGGNRSPDHGQLDLRFFQHMDNVMWQFYRAGLFVHLYFKVFNKGVNWPAGGSVEETAYFRYVTARYQAFPSVIWDFAKETYYEHDKQLVKNRMAQIASWDAHSRLRTIHDDLILDADPDSAALLHFVTAQQHHDFHASALFSRSRYARPYVNAELGYECGPGGELDVTYGIGQTPQEMVRRAYKVLFGGGYPSYYYTYTAWDVIHENANPPGYRFFRILSDTARKIGIWDYEPDPTLCLWRNSFAMRKGKEEYLLFVQKHTLAPPELSPSRVEGTWINMHTGSSHPVGSDSTQACDDKPTYTIYSVPFPAKEGLLHLRQRKGA